MGPSDHHAHDGQVRICTEKKRDKHDWIYVQEKLDGGNVGVAKVDGKILALTRAGYLAETSPYSTHFAFKEYVKDNEDRFYNLLNEGERLCGEWLLTAVGTIYELTHEPFVPFDLMTKMERLPFAKFCERVVKYDFTIPCGLSMGEPLSIDEAVEMIKVSGHGATEDVEGAVWRVERKGEVDFLAKYVRPDKVDGKYLESTIFNGVPEKYEYLKKFVT